MKKFFLLIILIFAINTTYAKEIDIDDYYQKKFNQVGFRILMSNHLENRATFKLVDTKKNKTHHSTRKKIVKIHVGAIKFIENDDELAAILSYHLSVLNDNHKSFFMRLSRSYSPLKYDKKDLKRMVDYMVNAGYDPVAAIIILNKTATQTDWYDFHFLNYQGFKEIMFVYNYIYDKYPAYLEDNKYKYNIYYQNFLMLSKKDREHTRKINEELLKMEQKNEDKLL